MYYEVIVASHKYYKNVPLTYRYNKSLSVGSVVIIPLQKEQTIGIVLRLVSKPQFSVKDILGTIVNSNISKESLKLIAWMNRYYPSPSGLIAALVAPSYLQTSQANIHDENHLELDCIPSQTITLNKEQMQAVNTVNETTGHSVLLHGKTGSGKTRVYIELARQALLKNKSVIVLAPEIGLTAQLVTTFIDVFGNRVVVMHSGLTPRQRHVSWQKISSSREPLIVIGARSSLFVPLRPIGLIVVDEMHDYAYKQEQAPYYETTRVSAKLAELHGGKALFGSATPPVHDYYIFEHNKLPIITMTGIATGTPQKTDVIISDLKDRKIFTRSKWLCDELLDQITNALSKKEQSLLFLNRRGTARVILCQNCGWYAVCPRCDLPLTYHGDSHEMVCHTCGYKSDTPTNCPTCKSDDILFKSAGTKTIVSEVERLFPRAIVHRFDSDVKKSNDLGSNMSQITDGKVDILVGTQMLSKGLDLPRLSVVGVVQADTALNFPDYTATERTFQMLCQVIGRVGRGHRSSTIVVQTHSPNSELLQQALKWDYKSFYTKEISERGQFKFPPFCHILKLTCERRSDSAARKAASSLAKTLASEMPSSEVIGPSPAFIGKINNIYRWQLVIKATKRSDLTRCIPRLPSGWTYDIDPTHLL